MNLTVNQVQGRVPVTIVAIQGDLDGSNYQTLIARAKAAYDAGTRHLLIDMSDMPFMASSGLVALHSIVKLLQGAPIPDPEAGWEALHAISREQTVGKQPFVKLLSPQPKVSKTLEMTGMNAFFETYTDRDTAVGSF